MVEQHTLKKSLQLQFNPVHHAYAGCSDCIIWAGTCQKKLALLQPCLCASDQRQPALVAAGVPGKGKGRVPGGASSMCIGL